MRQWGAAGNQLFPGALLCWRQCFPVFLVAALAYAARPLWGWLLLPLALLTNPFWSLIHEAIHDLLHPNKSVNLILGRLLAIMFGAPFRILRLSHLLHHKLNRMPVEGTEYYDRDKSSKAAAAPGYYFQILFGLYFVEVISPLYFLLPRRWLERFRVRYLAAQSVSSLLMQNWLGAESLREIRRDGALTILWLALAFSAYGENWPLLLAALAARALLISFLDNVYHYETPVSDVFFAKNLSLPKPLAGLLLQFQSARHSSYQSGDPLDRFAKGVCRSGGRNTKGAISPRPCINCAVPSRSKICPRARRCCECGLIREFVCATGKLNTILSGRCSARRVASR